MVDRFQQARLNTRLGIPLLYGVDTVHGDGNVYGATVFPHNIGLGATRDPALVREIEQITAEETRASGPQWAFAPCVCAARDDRWGRTYESFGEDPGLVNRMETAIDGFQGIARTSTDPTGCWPPRSTTPATATPSTAPAGDYTIDQGITITSRADFWRTSLSQYVPAVQGHHVGTRHAVVLQRRLDRGRRRQPDQDARQPRADHRRAQGSDGLRRLRDQRLGGHPPDPGRLGDAGPHRRQRRHRHVHGAHSPGLHHHAARRGQRRSRADDAHRRRRPPHPDQEVRARPVRASVHGPPQHRPGRLGGASRGRPPGRGRVAGAAEERRRGRCRCRRSATSTSPAATPTTSATRPAAGRSPGRAARRTIPGTTILRGDRAPRPARRSRSARTRPRRSRGNVGVVVVGETPYSEGFGDVGGPRWAFDPGDNGVPRPVKDMQLSAADKAAVDKVCAAARRAWWWSSPAVR